jgi:hypothetical protein
MVPQRLEPSLGRQIVSEPRRGPAAVQLLTPAWILGAAGVLGPPGVDLNAALIEEVDQDVSVTTIAAPPPVKLDHIIRLAP